MLYPKSKEEMLSDELFRSPSREYQVAPFWVFCPRTIFGKHKKKAAVPKNSGFAMLLNYSRVEKCLMVRHI